MGKYDERFAKAKENLVRKQQLEAQMSVLQEQQSDIMAKVLELREQKAKEQKDVDRLEHGSLVGFFLDVVGKKLEKLDKEKKEAYLAAVKCDAAERELEEIEARIDRTGEELIALCDCEQEYEALLQEKRSEIEAMGLPVTEEIMKQEQQILAVETRLAEAEEAMAAGTKARELAQKAYDKLNGADGWSTYDVWGGGFFADVMKHSEIDEAQKLIEELQVQLRVFETELADVQMDLEIRIDIDELLRFADYFFDGLFADLTVKKRIEDAVGQVEQTRENITKALWRLKDKINGYKDEITDCKNRINRLITEAAV